MAKFPKGSQMKRQNTKKLNKVVRKVNQLYSGIEQKYADLEVTSYSTDVAGVWHLTAVAEGDTTQQRTGAQISPKSLKINCMLTKDSNTGGVYEAVRIILVRDTQQVADTSPAPGTVLQTADVMSHYDRLTNRGRFKIIYDKVHLMGFFDTGGGDAHLPARRYFTIKKSWKSLKIQYNGNLSTDIEKNGLYLMAFSDITTSGNGSLLDFDSRIRYSDL